MNTTTTPPTSRISIPEGSGTFIRLIQTASGPRWACLMWFANTLWRRDVEATVAPTYDEVAASWWQRPGEWVCITNNN
jgi:hypothetical protein